MFKKGDKVVCVNARCAVQRLTIGKVYDVLTDDDYEGIRVIGDTGQERWVCSYRFELVKDPVIPAPPVLLPFVVGATVECLYDYHYIGLGEQRKLTAVHRDVMGGVDSIEIENCPLPYRKLERFKVVAAPVKEWNRADWKPQVGEQVYITGRDDGFATDMHELIGNGVVYTIASINHYIYLENHRWCYYKSGVALTPVNAGNGNAIIQHPAPKPRPVHEHADLRDDLISKACGSLCSFAFEYEDGSRWYERSGICHAYIGDRYGTADGHRLCKVRTQLVYNLAHQISNVENAVQASGHNTIKTTIEAHNKAAEYIILRSPWAVAFLTKDMEEAKAKGLFMDVEKNVNVIAASCVALRTCMEQGNRSDIFTALVGEGVGEHAAYLTACAFTYDEEDKFSFYGWGGGHDVFDKSLSFNGLVKFFKEGFYTPEGTVEKPYRTDHGKYLITAACSPIAGVKDSVGQWFKSNTEATVTGEGFYKESSITKQSVIDVAKKLDKIIQG